MTVIGGHQGYGKLLCKFDQFPVDPLLLFKTIFLEFDKEVFLSEDVLVLEGRPEGLIGLPQIEQIGNFSPQASTGGDETLAVFAQELLVKPGLIVEALQVGMAD
jgi:hypothetical protein